MSRLTTARYASLAFMLASAADTTAAQQVDSKLSVHGYLTQGYGISDRYPITGLTKEGTADYRRAAIVARYETSAKDYFVVQLAHRRLGDSPTMQFEENVKVDMAFYQHRFTNGTSVRVGKSLMPFGIYNEIRYAGTLLPFYRAPMSVYWEGTYTNETIDGVQLSHRLRSGKPWELSADLYGGSYSLLEFGSVMTSPTTATYAGARMDAKNALGAQLWLATPVEGLRLGVNGRRHTDVGGLYPRGNGVAAVEWNASVDGDFERWQLRAEGLRSGSMGGWLRSGYAQVGYRPVQLLSVNAQSEYSDIGSAAYTIKLSRDQAVAVNVFFNANTVLKLEAHNAKGYNVEQAVNYFSAPLKGSYFISSFSVSF